MYEYLVTSTVYLGYDLHTHSNKKLWTIIYQSEINWFELEFEFEFNPLVPRANKTEIGKLALTDFYWFNF